MEYSHPHEEGPSPHIEGWLHTLIAPELMTTLKTRVEDSQRETTQQPEHEDMLIENREG